MEKKYSNQDQVMGNLTFYKAYYYKFLKNNKQAKDCFKKARKYFSKCLENDNEVFNIIDEELKAL